MVNHPRTKSQRVVANLTDPILISVVYELTKQAAVQALLNHPAAARTEAQLNIVLNEALKRNLKLVHNYKETKK